MKPHVLSAYTVLLIITTIITAFRMDPDNQQRSCSNITEFLSPEQFESIKQFILGNGDRKTYRNIDGNNPHYQLESFDLYLNPEDPRHFDNTDTRQDFNEIVIYDRNNDFQYFIIRIVRDGNKGRSDTNRCPELTPGHTYLLNPYDEDIVKMKDDLLNRYLKKIVFLVSGTSIK